ncbi:MAG: myo-inositol 2-dehydrogenase/D-chiro-inositol 1-dehydrogenase [Saprospiraceae bacterium]|jgi:myo-inositol 2-dehydrogenase/D-chiro-inositol 1-dehydrogenase
MIINNSSRRDFVKKTGATVLGSSLGLNILSAKPSWHNKLNVDTIKVGLIGCGGRGTGAALQAVSSDPNVVLTAMADAFQDRLDTSYNALLDEVSADKVMVDNDHKFVGLDAYKKVLASDVDVVLLTTPPNFRPQHLEEAIASGKHVFCEKPVAVDAPGIRRVMAAAKKAKEKNLAVMSGFCWRHDVPKIDTFNRVLDGAVGDISSVYNTYNTQALWYHEPKEGWGTMETQLRNWLYYNWLSGDHIIEQAIHSIDMMSWALGDRMPLSASGSGGRQSRVEEQYGNIFDHFSIMYDYGDGVRGHHVSRQQKGTSRAYGVDVMGTGGRCEIDVFKKHTITNKDGEWNWDGKKSNMYQNEHNTLFASIRAGNPFNDGQRMAESTMLGIMGRMVAYTGKTLTYDEALASEEILGPPIEDINWDMDYPLAPVAQPGITKFK